MPRNPDKKRCSLPGCRAWAMRGRDRCAAHRREALEPQGSDTSPVGGLSLDDEIGMVRMINNRLLERLEESPVDDELLVRLARLLYQGAGQVARLLRDRRAISGDAEEGFSQAMGRVLDELNTLSDWDVQL